MNARAVVPLLLLLLGCSSPQKIEQPVEPTVADEPTEAHPWPAFFKDTRCAPIEVRIETPDLERNDRLAFTAAFEERLFAKGSPFVRVNLNGGQEPEFTVEPFLGVRLSNPGTSDAPTTLSATARVVLRGGYTKGRKEVTATIAHSQLSYGAELPEVREKLARTLGRLIARKLLATCAAAPDAILENAFAVTCTGFDPGEILAVVEILKVRDPSGPARVEERSRDGGRAEFLVHSQFGFTEFQQRLEQQLVLQYAGKAAVYPAPGNRIEVHRTSKQ